MNPELEQVLTAIITEEGVATYNATFNDNLSVETARQFAAFIWGDATAMFAKVSEHNRVLRSNYQNLLSMKALIESTLPNAPSLGAVTTAIEAFETAYPILNPQPEE